MIKLDKIDLNAHKDKIIDMMECCLDYLKDNDYDLYDEMKTGLYEMEYGKKINEEKAIKWVKNMKPAGMHWTMEETTMAMQKMGYNCDRIEFFVVSNMNFNDYFDIVKDDEELTFRLAYDWLNDKDAKSNKLYDYWKYIVKRD